MHSDKVIIAGGGIAGLSLALTLHQIGVDCVVYEGVSELAPLGVGINLQPNAVRELADMGIGEQELDETGVPAREWALVGLNGKEIYAEPRGKFAGYQWHQYAVHRGKFHLMLARAVTDRLGCPMLWCWAIRLPDTARPPMAGLPRCCRPKVAPIARCAGGC